MDHKLNMSQQHHATAKKRNIILRGINRSIVCSTGRIISPSYTELGKLQLEYCTGCCS